MAVIDRKILEGRGPVTAVPLTMPSRQDFLDHSTGRFETARAIETPSFLRPYQRGRFFLGHLIKKWMDVFFELGTAPEVQKAYWERVHEQNTVGQGTRGVIT